MQNFRHFYSATLIKLAANRSNLLVPFLPVRRRRVGDGTVELMIALAASALVRPAEAPNDELVIVIVNTTSPSPSIAATTIVVVVVPRSLYMSSSRIENRRRRHWDCEAWS